MSARAIEYQRRYLERLRADPVRWEKYRAAQRILGRKADARRKGRKRTYSPEYITARRERDRLRKHRKRQDPAFLVKKNADQRRYMQQRRQRAATPKKRQYRSPESKARIAVYNRERYHAMRATPEGRAKLQEYQRRYNAKASAKRTKRAWVKNNPMHVRAMRAAYVAKVGKEELTRRHRIAQKKSYDARMARLRADPAALAEWNAKRAAIQRRRLERMRTNNPEKYAALLERQRARELVRRETGARREWYARMKADKPRYARFLKDRREYVKRWRKSFNERKRIHRDPGAMLVEIQRLIPRSVPPELRGDLCNDLTAAILSGETTIERLQAGELRKYSRKVWALMPHAGKQVSLDDEIPGTDGLRRVDLIDADTAHF